MNTIAENILKKNTNNINTNEIDLVPVESGVLLKFYDDNPYRYIETEKSGLVLGMESVKKYKSNETGELEDNVEFVACAKVIATGPKCRNVNVGEDVFCAKTYAIPIPARRLGYYLLNESNILCRVINKENE